MSASPYVSRINQIDAEQLDCEIYKLLRNRTREIARYGAPGNIDQWQPEVDVLLRFLVWRYSLERGTSTFGQRLLNLHYANMDQRKAVLYLILSTLPEYLRERLLNDPRVRSAIAPPIRSLLEWTSNAIDLLQLLNLLLFLHRGTRPRLIELLLGLYSQSITANRPRNIGYSYMTRELLWHGLMELFTVGVPMINFHYLGHTLKRLWRRKEATRTAERSSPPLMDEATRCAYCDDSPILPSHAGCEHLFCYYCLKAHFTTVNVFHCPSCDVELHARDMRRYAVTGSPSNARNLAK